MTDRAPMDSGRTLIASDWHLGHFSPRASTVLAATFLERARAAGDHVILNGDIFEGLFETAAAAEASQPYVKTLIDELIHMGRLRRTEGNHDPGGGPPAIVLEHPAMGRVMVTHGHMADPMHRSTALRLGDGISRRFGRIALVRGAARLAESIAGLAGARVEAIFRERCLALLDASTCALGVFGHVHRQRLAAGDRYANAGCLHRNRLEYLVLDDAGARLTRLILAECPKALHRPGDRRRADAPSAACSPG